MNHLVPPEYKKYSGKMCTRCKGIPLSLSVFLNIKQNNIKGTISIYSAATQINVFVHKLPLSIDNSEIRLYCALFKNTTTICSFTFLNIKSKVTSL